MADEQDTGWHGYRHADSALWFAVDPTEAEPVIVLVMLVDGIARRVATMEDVPSATLVQDWMDAALAASGEINAALAAMLPSGGTGGA